jgi:hypothetical protein
MPLDDGGDPGVHPVLDDPVVFGDRLPTADPALLDVADALREAFGASSTAWSMLVRSRDGLNSLDVERRALAPGSGWVPPLGCLVRFGRRCAEPPCSRKPTGSIHRPVSSVAGTDRGHRREELEIAVGGRWMGVPGRGSRPNSRSTDPRGPIPVGGCRAIALLTAAAANASGTGIARNGSDHAPRPSVAHLSRRTPGLSRSVAGRAEQGSSQ